MRFFLAGSYAKSGRREGELLLDCARSYMTGEHRNDLALLDIDWDYLLRTASKHKMIPLLYHFLYVGYRERAPNDVLHRLTDLYRINAARNLLMTQELLQLLELFKNSAIPAIAFKGPVLAAVLYGDVSLRQFNDLDILIRERDVGRATSVLHTRGYLAGPKLDCEQHFKQDPLTLDLTVDLHWSITHKNHSFPLTTERLWEQRDSKILFGKTIATMGPEETLLVLCFNGAKDGWASLSHICDIAKLLGNTNAIDWINLIEKSRQWGCQRIVLLGLYLASHLLEAALPATVVKAISSHPTLPRLAEQVRGRLFAEGNRSRPWEAKAYWHQLRMREGLRERITYYGCMGAAVIAPNEKNGMVLRSVRQIIYYSLRPLWRVAKRGVRFLIDFHSVGRDRRKS